MKHTVSVYLDALPLVRVRFADYVELIRPRIALLVLFTGVASLTDLLARFIYCGPRGGSFHGSLACSP